MAEDYYRERKEWSERKHRLLAAYLTPFVKILGGAWRGIVYYVDGFSGPGIYEDGSIGSPVLAAQHATRLQEEGKHYGLCCINIELGRRNYVNLELNTKAYSQVAQNYHGTFGQHIENVLETIADYPALFFLDPFGVKGMEWRHVEPVLHRKAPTDILLRFDSLTIARLAGSASSSARQAAAKTRRLTEVYGVDSPDEWIREWRRGKTPQQRGLNMLRLYLRCLRSGINTGTGSYAAAYSIRDLEGRHKYYIAFASRHPKAAVLMSNTVCEVEASYEQEVQEYRERTTLQPTLPGMVPPKEEIFREKVRRVKDDLVQRFGGQTVSRLSLHAGLLGDWFGRIKSKHLTQALKELEETGSVTRDGPRSKDATPFTFKRGPTVG